MPRFEYVITAAASAVLTMFRGGTPQRQPPPQRLPGAGPSRYTIGKIERHFADTADDDDAEVGELDQQGHALDDDYDDAAADAVSEVQEAARPSATVAVPDPKRRRLSPEAPVEHGGTAQGDDGTPQVDDEDEDEDDSLLRCVTAAAAAAPSPGEEASSGSQTQSLGLASLGCTTALSPSRANSEYLQQEEATGGADLPAVTDPHSQPMPERPSLVCLSVSPSPAVAAAAAADSPEPTPATEESAGCRAALNQTQGGSQSPAGDSFTQLVQGHLGALAPEDAVFLCTLGCDVKWALSTLAPGTGPQGSRVTICAHDDKCWSNNWKDHRSDHNDNKDPRLKEYPNCKVIHPYMPRCSP